MKSLTLDNFSFILIGIGSVLSAYAGNWSSTIYALLAMYLQYKIIKSK